MVGGGHGNVASSGQGQHRRVGVVGVDDGIGVGDTPSWKTKLKTSCAVCQALFKLGLPKPAFTDVDVVFPVFTKKVAVIFHLPKNLGCLPFVEN